MLSRIDKNQKEIVAFFRSYGATVAHLHEVGKGCPDLCVGYKGENLLVEIKDGSRPPSARKLTPVQKEFHDNWTGKIYIIESVQQAKELLEKVLSQITS